MKLKKLLKLSIACALALSTNNAFARPIQDEVFYLVMPDRFANGDTANDTGSIVGNANDHGFDPSQSNYYHGGDLKGLKSKLNYIQNLGATAIWLTPIFKNQATAKNSAAYHGYWPTDFTQVDPHFGSNTDLKELVKAAHKRGMKVFFDIVVNHTADIVRFQECHDPSTGDLLPGLTKCAYRTSSESTTNPYHPFFLANQENIKVPSWLNDTKFYHNQGDNTYEGESSLLGDFDGLDDLRTEDPEVVSGFVDIAKFWIEHFRIDGFRMDTVKHVDVDFWKSWTPQVVEFAKSKGIDDFFIFGEIFDGDPRGVSYFTQAGKLPSALDFPLYFPAARVFSGQSAPSDFMFTFDRDDRYTKADGDATSLLSFVSNHDVGRIAHQIAKNLPNATEAEKLARVKLAYAFLFFNRGVPVIYYGDEQGYVGDGADKDAREDLLPSLVPSYNDNDLLGTDKTTADGNYSQGHPLYKSISHLANLYKLHAPLRRGTQFVRYAESSGPGILAISRVGADKREYLVLFNTATTAKSIALAATSPFYGNIQTGAVVGALNGQVNVSVPALSYTVLKGFKPIATVADNVTASLDVHDVGGTVKGEVVLDVDVSNESASVLPLNNVTFSVKVGDGEFASLGTDKNPDYRVYWNTDTLANGTPVTFKAEVMVPGAETITLTKDVIVNEAEGMFIRFKKPSNWSAANIYWFDASVNSPAWPGTPMRNHGDNWYSFQFPQGVQNATVIFNDGNGNQTANLPRQGNGCFADNAWSNDCVLPFNVYFHKPNPWGNNINLHFWDAGAAGSTNWPGNAMTSLGEGWYSYKFTEGTTSANLIFNDGAGNQTANLSRNSTGCYLGETDTWVDVCTLPQGSPLGKLYVRGGMNGWGTDNELLYVGSNEYRASINLAASQTGFKIANADWSFQLGAWPDGVVNVGEPKTLQTVAFGGDLSITPTTATTYTFSLNVENTQAPVLTVFVAGPYGDTTLYLRGDMNGWSTTLPLTYNMDGTYRVTTALNPGNYNFKIADANWSQGTNFGAAWGSSNIITFGTTNLLQDQSSSNLVISIPASGSYTFALDANTSQPGQLLTEPRLMVTAP